MHFVIKKAEVYNFEIRDVNQEFKLMNFGSTWGRVQRGAMKHLLLKDVHLHLSSDKSLRLERFNNLMRNVNLKKQIETYDTI